MRHVAKLLAFAVLGVGLIVVAGVVLSPRDDGRSGAAPAMARETDPIAAAQSRLQRLPRDWTTWAELGMAYVQRARVTGDPADYPRAQQALERSLEVRPEQNAAALTGLGALAAARHDFPLALRHGQAAVAVDPYRAAALGVVADALTELGRYPEAFDTVQRMVDLRPDTASYARASYTWELRGDLPRANDAMLRALEAAANPQDAVFARYHLGELAYAAGDLETAATHFAEGSRFDPRYPPLRAGQARVRAARGDTATAVAEFQAIVASVPNPSYAAELGDLLVATGQEAAGARQYALARAGWTGSAEPESVLFAADQRDPGAVEQARKLYARQPGYAAADALAWALRSAGQPAAALVKADEALRLGTRSAMLHYHRGMILADLGRDAAARDALNTALRLNPHFSIRHAATARATLASLGGAR
ncbi:tetratricopeptide repeat protein [Actinoplanes aureus]|uniref:Tetratricopeptide repeat protein n=1 Tax=Actinoplanes aureus TaxID=2792083 RepID=A0A931CB90_9ACTN|nr:tetratricopeptide repeat protein [Actinoplanes aureus]MBG0563948.1 tetratricopeptide repeat protein [Actinoplanes aureus]